VALVLTAPVGITVSYLGRPDTSSIVMGYLGAFLMGGAYLAVSILCSALTRSQIVSFVLSVAVISLFVYADSPALLARMGERVPAFIIEAVANMSVVGHFESMQRGVLEFRDLTYYSVLITGLVAMTCIVVDHRRQSC